MPGSADLQTLTQNNAALLHKIINNELPTNQSDHHPAIRAAGKRQLETRRACPQIWVQNVSDEDLEQKDDENEDLSSPTYHVEHSEMVQTIARWLYSVQNHGFSAPTLQKYLRPEINEDDEDDTWWDESVVRVFLPCNVIFLTPFILTRFENTSIRKKSAVDLSGLF